MQIIHLISSLLIMCSFTACADQTGSDKSEFDMSQYQWKNRIILSYPASDKDWSEQEKYMNQQSDQIKERDIIVIRVDEPQRQALIEKYGLKPGTHLLIGKDGEVKQKQSGKLDLPPLFNLIDQMPMRKEEMKSSKAK
jgi:hypothetical protein